MDQEKTYKWIQDRLRDLHSGTLSEADRVRLDELAINDPFLKDALEGYKSHTNHDHSLLLKILSQRIQHKSISRRPKLLPLSRGWILQAVAASLVLILATWAVIYYVEKQDDTVLVAAETESSSSIEHSTEVQLSEPDSSKEYKAEGTATSVETENAPSGLRANAQAQAKDFVVSKAKEKNEAKAKAEAKESIIAEITLKEPDNYTFIDSDIATTTSPPPPTIEETREEAEEINPKVSETIVAGADAIKNNSKRDEGLYSNQMSPVLMAQRVTGQVMDRNGEALIGAMISIPNTNLVTTADFYGRFELYLPEPTSIIEVTYTGYEDTTFTVAQGQEDLVFMLEEGKLDMPAGILAGNESKFQGSKSETATGVFPGNSVVMFLEYLKANSRYPVQSHFNPASKEVTIEFTITADGRPDIIKMIKSSAEKKYIAEAMRLIKMGPDWICESDVYPCMKRYTIYFQ